MNKNGIQLISHCIFVILYVPSLLHRLMCLNSKCSLSEPRLSCGHRKRWIPDRRRIQILLLSLSWLLYVCAVHLKCNALIWYVRFFRLRRCIRNTCFLSHKPWTFEIFHFYRKIDSLFCDPYYFIIFIRSNLGNAFCLLESYHQNDRIQGTKITGSRPVL